MSTQLRPVRIKCFEKDSHVRAARGSRRGVLLINLGTPDEPSVPVVRRYLGEFLRDPEVIHLPRGLRWANRMLGSVLARWHAPAAAARYRKIWTDKGSPLKIITEHQAKALEHALPRGWRVFHAMRYAEPTIHDTLEAIEQAGIDELVVVPMYPQFSGPTTGTVMRLLRKRLDSPAGRMNLAARTTWYDDYGYIDAQATLIQEQAHESGLSPFDTHLLFTAHGLPVSYVEHGDPYLNHLHRSIDLVMRRLGWPSDRASIAFQNPFGMGRWLKPFIDTELIRLRSEGVVNVLVCPISYTTDCLETLEEIGMRHRKFFEQCGGRLFLCPALNTHELFVSALKNLVLKGVRPMGDQVEPLSIAVTAVDDVEPGSRRVAESELDSLVMIGMSLPNRIGSGSGPKLVSSDPERLLRAKRPQSDVPDLLRSIRDEGGIREVWLWNTCHRFELYACLDEDIDPAARDRIVARIRERLFDCDAQNEQPVNVLRGGKAWHHLLRTVSGLNSGLPGDKEIVEQLDAAHRLAHQAGTAGLIAQRIVRDAVAIEADVRDRTPWGRYDVGYCHAALIRTAQAAGVDFSSGRIVVIGGSTTSRSVLTILRDRFDVQSRDLLLLYRGHKKGGQIKLLRKAIGSGRRVRLGSYDEPQVVQAVADANIVIFGVDRDESILTPDKLAQCRDFVERPLVIIDFNTYGSTTNLESIEGVTVITAQRLEEEVDAFAADLCSSGSFSEAVAAAEACITDHAIGTAGDRDRSGGPSYIAAKTADRATVLGQTAQQGQGRRSESPHDSGVCTGEGTT